jgi:hypothetical protein
MAKAKTTKKSQSSKKSIVPADSRSLLSASAILFAGTCIVLLGAIQNLARLQLVLVGFGAALLVVGGALLGMATKTAKR